MKKRILAVVWGLCLVSAGVLITGNVLGWWSASLFFNGWWTLFIIVPCIINLLVDGIGCGSLTGASIGIMLLLEKRNMVEFTTIFRILVPLILVYAGISIFYKNIFPYRHDMASGFKVLWHMISLALTTICFVVLGAVLVFAQKNNSAFNHAVSENHVEFYEEYEDVHNLHITMKSEDISIVKGDKLSVQSSAMSSDISVYAEDGTLYLKEKSKVNINRWLDAALSPSIHSYIIITVPEETYQTFYIDSGSGLVSIEGLESVELIADFGSGHVSIIECSADTAKINTASGKVSVVDSVIHEMLKVDSGSGLFSYQGALSGQAFINSGSGNVVFSLKGTIDDYYIVGNHGSGGIWINGEKKESFVMGESNADHSIHINGGSGRVTVEVK